MGSHKNRSRRESRCSARGGDLGMRWDCRDIMGGILLVGCSPTELCPLFCSTLLFCSIPFAQHPPPLHPPPLLLHSFPGPLL